jgi:hypothetical protein
VSNTPLYPSLYPTYPYLNTLTFCTNDISMKMMKFFPYSSCTEEITISPNSQWFPVPVKLDVKEEGWCTDSCGGCWVGCGGGGSVIRSILNLVT